MRRGQASTARCDQQDLHLKRISWELSVLTFNSELSWEVQQTFPLSQTVGRTGYKATETFTFLSINISQLSVCLVSHLLMIILSGDKQ